MTPSVPRIRADARDLPGEANRQEQECDDEVEDQEHVKERQEADLQEAHEQVAEEARKEAEEQDKLKHLPGWHPDGSIRYPVTAEAL